MVVLGLQAPVLKGVCDWGQTLCKYTWWPLLPTLFHLKKLFHYVQSSNHLSPPLPSRVPIPMYLLVFSMGLLINSTLSTGDEGATWPCRGGDDLEMWTRWNSFTWSPALAFWCLSSESLYCPLPCRWRCLHTGGPQDRDWAEKPFDISAPGGVTPTSDGPRSLGHLSLLVLLYFSFSLMPKTKEKGWQCRERGSGLAGLGLCTPSQPAALPWGQGFSGKPVWQCTPFCLEWIPFKSDWSLVRNPL